MLGLPSQSRPWREAKYRRSGAATGKGRSRRASMRRNADVQAPIPKASERIAAAEVTLCFFSCRQPYTASASSDSSQETQCNQLRGACGFVTLRPLSIDARVRQRSRDSVTPRREIRVDYDRFAKIKTRWVFRQESAI